MTSPGASGGALSVDYDALARTAAHVQALVFDLSATEVVLSGMVGDAEISDALDHAERDWSSQRRRLHGFFEQALAGLNSSLAAYQDTDSQVATAAHAAGGLTGPHR